jgi:hypothetical protein
MKNSELLHRNFFVSVWLLGFLKSLCDFFNGVTFIEANKDFFNQKKVVRKIKAS